MELASFRNSSDGDFIRFFVTFTYIINISLPNTESMEMTRIYCRLISASSMLSIIFCCMLGLVLCLFSLCVTAWQETAFFLVYVTDLHLINWKLSWEKVLGFFENGKYFHSLLQLVLFSCISLVRCSLVSVSTLLITFYKTFY